MNKEFLTLLIILSALQLTLAQGLASLESSQGAINQPPCPPGIDTILYIDNFQLYTPYNVDSLLIHVGLPLNGYWEPELFNSAYYDFCTDDPSVYIYPHTYPGCAPVLDTVDFDVMWSPCGWEFESFCEANDTFYLTIPPFDAAPDMSTYYINMGYNGNWQYVLSVDSSYSFAIIDSNFSCFLVSVQLNTYANWYWGLGAISLEGEYTYYYCDYPACACADPPYAGEDNDLSFCIDTNAFDLFEIIPGNPDPGGTWTPPLASGGNVYDPILDGSGTFIYTVAASQCPQDQALITLNVEDLVSPVISGIPDTLCTNDTILQLPTSPNGISGSWSGPGVSDNFFNPAGLAGTITLTFTPDPYQCSSTKNISIEIIPFVIIIPSGIPDAICETDMPVQLPAIQSGIPGTWVGPGISNNNFNPEGLSGNILIWFAPLEDICVDPVSAEIAITSPGTLTPPVLPQSICSLDPALALPSMVGGYPGNWTGPGVSNNYFYPENLTGLLTLTFHVEPAQCVQDVNLEIFVNPTVVPDLSGVPPVMCMNAPPVPLPSSPGGITGQWSGPGVSNDTFSPNGLQGMILITFSPDSGQCTLAQTVTIDILDPVITMPEGVPASFCETASAFSLPTVDHTIPGRWIGPGVVNNMFLPLGLNGVITLAFIPDSGQCAVASTINIQVDSLIQLPSAPADTVCESLPQLMLPNTPGGFSGTWSGPGVTNPIFNPSGLQGLTLLTFVPDSGQCVSPVNLEYFVAGTRTPLISGIPDSICPFDTVIHLPNLQDNITGYWTGSGVMDNDFHPAGLSGAVILNFIPDTGQCANAVITTIYIDTQLILLLNPMPGVCENGDSINLPIYQDGVYGTWNGPGISNNTFNPEGLSGIQILTFTPDSVFCASPVNTSIEVSTPPGFGNVVANCDTATSTYTVSFDIYGGQAGSYLINTTPWSGTVYTSPPIPADSMYYTFILSDSNQCGTVEISGFINCNCETYAGTMVSTPSPLMVCLSGTIPIMHAGDQRLDYDDLLGFVLYENADSLSGHILAIGYGGALGIPNGVQPGTTYYLSAIAGSDSGTGQIDLSDHCLSISPGIPIVFYQPEALISPGGSICSSDCFMFQVELKGEKPFTLEYVIQANGDFFPRTLSVDSSHAEIRICPADFGISEGDLTIDVLSLTDRNCTYLLPDSSTAELRVYPAAYTHITGTFCLGHTITIEGITFNDTHPSGVVTIPNGSMHGCDSIIVVQLTFDSVVIASLDMVLCPGDSFTINQHVYDESNPEGSEVFENGSVFGCDSVLNIQVNFLPPAVGIWSDTICPGDFILVHGTRYDSSHTTGMAILEDASIYGCDSMVMVHLYFYPAAQGIIMDTLEPGDSYELFGHRYDLSNPSGREVIYGGSSQGCDSTIYILLQFLSGRNDEIVFPNLFTPNGDGKNDIATLYSKYPVQMIRFLRIYSRWGELVLEYTNIPTNDSAYGWDGTYRGHDLDPGVFIWTAEVEFENGVNKLFSGDITLVR